MVFIWHQLVFDSVFVLWLSETGVSGVTHQRLTTISLALVEKKSYVGCTIMFG